MLDIQNKRQQSSRWRLLSFMVFTVIVIAGLVKLGLWQSERGAHKEALERQLLTHQHQSPLSLTDIKKMPYDKITGLPMSELVNLHPRVRLLLDNQRFNGVIGYQLLVPATVASESFLINIGWLPADLSRDVLPEIPPLPKRINVTGWVKPASQLVVLDQAYLMEQFGSVYRIQTEDLAAISDQLDIELLPWVLLLDEQQDWGLPRQWNWVTMSAEKHYGYAIQWFAMALALTVALVVVVMRSRRREP